MRTTLGAVAAALIVSLILVSDCKKPQGDNVIGDRTRLPEENASLDTVLIQGDTLKLVYKHGSSKPAFVAGDIVVGKTGEGYLKKVISSASSGDTLVLLTSQAALTDAIIKCDVESTLTLVPESTGLARVSFDTSFLDQNGVKQRMLLRADGPVVKPLPSGFEFEVRLPNVSIEISNQNGLAAYLSCDTVILKKAVDVDLGVTIKDAEVQAFRAIAQSGEEVRFKGVEVGLVQSIVGAEKQLKLTTVPLGQVTLMAGPVPIVFVFELGVYVGFGADLSLNLSSQISNNVSLSSTTTLGARYETGTWTPVFDRSVTGSADFGFSPPELTMTAALQDFLKGSLDTKIYGVAGPSLYLKPYLYDEVTAPPLKLEVGGGIAAGLGFKVEILSLHLVEFDWTFADYKWAIAETTFDTTSINRPPGTSATPSGHSSGQVGVSYDFTTSATDPDTDQVKYQFDWGDGTQSDWSSLVPSGQQVQMSYAWPATGTYNVKARAKDEHGSTSSWSAAHQIAVGGGGGEMVLNGGFESDFDHWGAHGSFDVLDSGPHGGQKCARILFAYPGYYDRGLDCDHYLRLQQGTTYHFSTWVREMYTRDTYDSTRTIFDIGVVVNRAWYPTYGDSASHAQSPNWRLVERSFTPTETDTAAYVSVQIHGYAMSPGAFAVIDDVSIRGASE